METKTTKEKAILLAQRTCVRRFKADHPEVIISNIDLINDEDNWLLEQTGSSCMDVTLFGYYTNEQGKLDFETYTVTAVI